MKALLKKATERLGGHLFSRESLPTGVNWLLDIQRGMALSPAPVCFDVGANIGQTVAELLRVIPDARIHAFEPFAEPLAVLRRSTSGDARVTVVERAMGSTPGRMEVRPNRMSLLNSLVHRDESTSREAAEAIDIDTVDDYCARLGIDRIDVLKSDTEGYDLEVLRGASALLASQRIGYVYVEVTFLRGNPQNSLFGPILEWLERHDYRFLGLYETFPLHFYQEPVVFCNALFVASSVRERSLTRRRSSTQP
jgi:FkbM family methyltransferase